VKLQVSRSLTGESLANLAENAIDLGSTHTS